MQVTLAHSDHDRDTTLTTLRSMSCHADIWITANLGSPLPGDASIISTNPSGECTLVVKPGTTQTIEVWTSCRKKAHIEVPSEIHGSIMNDGFFGHGFTWSVCGRYAAFTAEVIFWHVCGTFTRQSHPRLRFNTCVCDWFRS